jgi:folate-binding protein YgfZ
MIPVEALDPSHVDAGVAAHYGDPMREQRQLANEVGLVDRSNRGVIAIPGADRHTWLHSFTTQHLAELAPMTGTELLVLSPHGHVEHHAVALDDGEMVLLDVEPGGVDALLRFLLMMRFGMNVDPTDASAQWAVLSLVGPRALDVLAAHGVVDLAAPVVSAVPGPKFAAGSVPSGPSTRYGVASWPGGGYVRRMSYGADLIVPRSTVGAVLAEVPRAGIWAFEALRVADRRPRMGFETDHRTLPAEVGWIAPAVHLEKGCYRGQETVARVHNLGQPPRRLVLLHLDGVTSDELPAPGTLVSTVDGRAVGFVGTAARHYELGQIALAVVKKNVADDAVLRVGSSAAAIES